MRGRFWIVVASLVVLVGAGVSSPAQAAFPGQNGKIAFVGGCAGVCLANPDGSGEISVGPAGTVAPAWSPDGSKLAVSNYDLEAAVAVMNADGTGFTVIASTIWYFDGAPTWSPDGTRLAFIRDTSGDDPAIWTINADGTGASELFNPAANSPGSPAWSPDGGKIAFSMQGDIWTVNQDGTGATQVTDAPGPPGSGDFEPNWSPDGTKIAFRSSKDGNPEIHTVDADGSNPQRLTVTNHAERDPAWSPDGTRIVFQRTQVTSPCGPCPTDIWAMDSDGSDATNLTNDTAEESTPDWQPIPINNYARPKGATPSRFALVPAYRECVSPNRTHGPPLAYPSCGYSGPGNPRPPVPASPNVTVGTPDNINGDSAPANFIGTVNLGTIVGNPGTSADEADVRVAVHATDLRCPSPPSGPTCGPPNLHPGYDYTGDLQGAIRFQITDKNNMPHPGGPGAATVQEFPILFTIPCVATSTDDRAGGQCALTSTMDALVPGSVVEGQRAIWQIGQVQVFDGGPDADADTPDNSLFAVQGIFVP